MKRLLTSVTVRDRIMRSEQIFSTQERVLRQADIRACSSDMKVPDKERISMRNPLSVYINNIRIKKGKKILLLVNQSKGEASSANKNYSTFLSSSCIEKGIYTPDDFFFQKPNANSCALVDKERNKTNFFCVT